MYLPFYPVRENAVLPKRGNPSDAGMDVFYCPDKNLKQVKGTDIEITYDGDEVGKVLIRPGGNVMLPTGLKAGIPHGYALFVCNRGSMGAKKGLVFGAHIIDSGYEGEIFIDLHNISNYDRYIYQGDKIAQVILMPVVACIPLESGRAESLYGAYPITISNRGEGMLGSTGQ